MDAGKILKQLADKLGVQIILKGEAQKHMRYLQQVPLLKHISAAELNSIVMSLEVCHFSGGEVVIKEGDTGKDMFIVESGTAYCTKGALSIRPVTQLAFGVAQARDLYAPYPRGC
jgi:CRP-like cAMP-binding protein